MASVVIAGIGSFSGIVVADTGVSNVSVDEKASVDKDGDGYYAALRLSIDADTRINQWADPNEQPYFSVSIGNKQIITRDVEQRSGVFHIKIQSTNLKIDRGVHRVSVQLKEKDISGDDKFGRSSFSVKIEPKSEDLTIRQQSERGIEDLSRSYKTFNDIYDSEWWSDKSKGLSQETVDALKPDMRSTTMNFLTSASSHGSFATNLVTLTEQIIYLFLSVKASTISSLMESPSSYSNFRTHLSSLHQNTQKIVNEKDVTGDGEFSTEDKEKLFEKRESLIENLYKSQNVYSNNVESNTIDLVEDPENVDSIADVLLAATDWVADVDKDTARAITGGLEQLEENLRADYLYTQAWLDQQDPKKYAYSTLPADQEGSIESPKPAITSISVPSEATVGEKTTITITVENKGSTASWQSIAASFPNASRTDSIKISDHSFNNPTNMGIYSSGEQVGALYGQENTDLKYPLMEIGDKWESGEKHQVTMTVLPSEEGTFQVYVKSVADARKWSSDPGIGDTETVDQQAESVYKREITFVKPAPNEGPEARLSGPPEVKKGESFTLEAGNSNDPDGKNSGLSYRWSVDKAPSGANPSLPNGPKGSIQLSETGEYEFEVTVSDGESSTSATATVRVTEKSTPTPVDTPTSTPTDTPTDMPTTTSTNTPTSTTTITSTPTDTVTVTSTTASGGDRSKSDRLQSPFTEEFTSGLNGWTANLPSEWAPRASEGDGSWSEKHGGSIRLHVAGGPSHIGVHRELGEVKKGSRITVNYESTNLEGSPGGPRILLHLPESDKTPRLDMDEGQSDSTRNGTLVGTVPQNLPAGTELEIRLGVWPGEITAYITDITLKPPSDMSSADSNNTNREDPNNNTDTNRNDSNNRNHLRITKDEQGISDGEVTYQFSVSGDLKPGEKAENGEVHNSASAEGTMGPTSGTDDFYFTGEITGFELQGDAVVYLDGDQVDPSKLAAGTDGSGETGQGENGTDGDSSSPEGENYLRVTKDAQGVSDGRVQYQFQVSDSLRSGAKAESGEVTDATSAKGSMGPTSGTDDFYFTGEITSFELQGDAVVYLNGEQIDPSTIADVKKSSKSSQTPTIDGSNSENSDQSGEDVDIEANGSGEGIDVSVDGPGFGFPASIAALLIVAYFFIRRT